LLAVKEFQRRDRRFGGLSEPVQIVPETSPVEAITGTEFEEIAVSSQ